LRLFLDFFDFFDLRLPPDIPDIPDIPGRPRPWPKFGKNPGRVALKQFDAEEYARGLFISVPVEAGAKVKEPPAPPPLCRSLVLRLQLLRRFAILIIVIIFIQTRR
jgi:hypothetical protein